MALPIVLGAVQLQRLARACRLVTEVLEETGAAVRPGVRVRQLDVLAGAALGRRGGRSAMHDLPLFSGHICISPNEVACHGVPDDRELHEGDIVNLDVAARAPGPLGYYGDTSATFYVGTPSATTRRLVEATHAAVMAGLDAVRPGRPLGEVGAAIEAEAKAWGYRVVPSVRGHGIGPVLHGAPSVPHHGGSGVELEMVPGLAITLEPALVRGSTEVRRLADRWSVVTVDGGWSAQFEHTVVVTEKGHELLTRRSVGVSPGR